MKRLLLTIFISIIILLLSICENWEGSFSTKEYGYDLNEIMKKGSLTVATSNNSSDYFLYKGEPMGFQLEMLEELGNYLGLKIDVTVCNNPGENVQLLNSGKSDIIASSWNLALDKKHFIEASIPILRTDLLLVQRKPEKNLIQSGIFRLKPLISDVKDLRGKSVYIPLLSAQGDIMKHFAKEKNIQIVEMPQYSQEKLVGMVANGELDYTICNSILAETLKGHYPDLDFNTVVKKSEPIVWTFRKTSPVLANKVNNWLLEFQKTTRFTLLLDKYFNQQKNWAVNENRYIAYRENRISRYDDLIKKYSAQIDWDWRLLASLIYQESRFLPKVRSYRGAFGLMQLMPATQEFFGIDTTANPEQQISAGVRYIKFLNRAFTGLIIDPKERINFILASYNIGPGHIFDALKLAHKYGKNPQKWFDNVDSCLLKNAEPQNYKDPIVEYGYCKGTETFSFVQEIIERYHHYKNVVQVK